MAEILESLKRKEAMDSAKTIRERRKNEDPLSIQVYKNQRTGPAHKRAVQPTPRTDEGDLAGLYIPDYAWMTRWAAVPFTRLSINPTVFYSKVQKPREHRSHAAASIQGLPIEIIGEIFSHLEPPSQVCLALSSKIFLQTSSLANRGNGLMYSRGERLRLMWRLKSWMLPKYKMCALCEKYYPTDPRIWKARKLGRRARTCSNIYGRNKDDFEFVGPDCPECKAEQNWTKVQIAQKALLQVLCQ